MGKFIIRTVPAGIKFDLLAEDGRSIAASEVYKSKASCMAGVKSVIKNAPIADIENQTVQPCAPARHPKFEMYEDAAGRFRFRLKATNGQIVAVSEGYTSLAACENGIESVRRNAFRAEIITE